MLAKVMYSPTDSHTHNPCTNSAKCVYQTCSTFVEGITTIYNHSDNKVGCIKLMAYRGNRDVHYSCSHWYASIVLKRIECVISHTTQYSCNNEC